MRPLMIELTTCTMARRIPVTSQIMIFVICLTQPPKNHFLCLTTYIIDKQMAYLWDLHLVQPQLIFSCVVLKVNGFGIVLMISNLCSIDVMLMRYLHCFLLLIMQINLRSMSFKHINKKFSIGKEKDGCLPFLDVNIFRGNNKFATNLQWSLYQLQIFITET